MSMMLSLEQDVASLVRHGGMTTSEGLSVMRSLVDAVSRLTKPEREARLHRLIGEADRIYGEALKVARTDGGPRAVAATVTMFSGGNDSTVLAHLFRNRSTHVGMANTGIGIEQTRQYVRDTSASWGLPVVEKHPPPSETYEKLVLGECRARTGPRQGTRLYAGGFPGPGAHPKIFQKLKERAFDQIRNELVSNPYWERVVFLAGRRATESARRNRLAFQSAVQRKGSIVWAAPLVSWTSMDMNTYRLVFPDVPRNEVADLLEQSGECLCGCFAHQHELREIRDWFPDVAAYIDELQDRVRKANPPGVQVNPRAATWGWAWAKDLPAEACECRSA